MTELAKLSEVLSQEKDPTKIREMLNEYVASRAVKENITIEKLKTTRSLTEARKGTQSISSRRSGAARKGQTDLLEQIEVELKIGRDKIMELEKLCGARYVQDPIKQDKMVLVKGTLDPVKLVENDEIPGRVVQAYLAKKEVEFQGQEPIMTKAERKRVMAIISVEVIPEDIESELSELGTQYLEIFKKRLGKGDKRVENIVKLSYLIKSTRDEPLIDEPPVYESNVDDTIDDPGQDPEDNVNTDSNNGSNDCFDELDEVNIDTI